MGNNTNNKTSKMQRGTQAGQMRLNREGKMAKKDIETQLKKTGKINDGFICLPDPEDIYTWYYIVFNLDYKEYKGGFYMGKIICPKEYPAKAPKVIVQTTNGRFHTWNEGICLSISDYHPESWNPVWKVSQIVIGLTSFWQTREDTYGGIYDSELGNLKKKGESDSDCRIRLAKESRDHVLKHEKYHIFEPYAKAIGIDQVPEIEGWKEHQERLDKIEAELAGQKRIAEEKKQKEEEARRLKAEKEAEERRIKEEKEAALKMERIKIDFMKMVAGMQLNKGKKMRKAVAA